MSTNIEDIYHNYLTDIQEKRNKQRRDRDEYRTWFGASSAGSCYKKQYYRVNGYEEKMPNSQSMRNMRVGTVIHDDIAKSMEHHLSKWRKDEFPILVEYEITIPTYKVIGHLDIAFFTREDGYTTAHIHDLKTAHSFKWKRMFGIKKNRETNPSENYELQLATYAIGLEWFDNEACGIRIDLVRMYLDYFKKDNAAIKTVEISNDYIHKATDYWKNLLEELDGVTSPDDLVPTKDIGVPFYNWECRYCGFLDICDTPLANKEKKDNGSK